MAAGAGQRGELAIVLHTHMPYVEGFGTWPFGEEWLWEAVATSYLPLLELLARGAPLTLSLTPVLCDQLEAPAIAERFEAFLHDVRRETHRRDVQSMRAAGQHRVAAALEHSAGDYEQARERFAARGADLLAAFASYAQWTSAATHAVLPLLATDGAVRLQVQSGIDSHLRRFGDAWRGGFWMPECAHAPWLDGALADAGVHATCVDFTRRLGRGAAAHLSPLLGDAGLVLVPIDRTVIELVWSDGGYPSHGAYRDYYGYTPHHHRAWCNDGNPYDHERALAVTREHAADFVARTLARLHRDGAGRQGGGLAVCALDTELLGHWWYEGVAWLEAVLDEAARQGLAIARLDDALARREPLELEASGAAAAEHEVSSWGRGGDLSTWSGPAVADLAWAARAAELRVVAARRANAVAARHLLALQASDWAFLVSRELAAPYARARAAAHLSALMRALEGDAHDANALRNIAPGIDPSLLLGP